MEAKIRAADQRQEPISLEQREAELVEYRAVLEEMVKAGGAGLDKAAADLRDELSGYDAKFAAMRGEPLEQGDKDKAELFRTMLGLVHAAVTDVRRRNSTYGSCPINFLDDDEEPEEITDTDAKDES